ncbi:Rpn family recombination-promoting nuclease/putative transposase [Parabacteroides sp. AD58]|uniref:Rpn family recombination-promoting nuclease/putative transposase n=1 Tax=Parabacteroides absconsus TaxID=2951805 RepID=A0ABZ2IMR8_9BACT|nr:Rpn family recombination-promoting nuclease/putative transposase [Parabacteroides sp. AD58]MCM6902004.1 Rpn family recombination-promoting nuclease/putative transposase [Parabacteroides sp. AD58]
MRKSVFINPFVDRGFKILFGQESSKELLIELINDLLEGEHHVEDLSYMDKEDPSETTDGRGTVFDLLCKDQDGTTFIVELQNARQTYFYERALYYLCRMIASQGKKGESWEFELVPVYGIFLLNFRSGKTDKVRTDLVIADRETGKQKSRNFREIFIEFPLFNKAESECKTPLDYWLYNLKHMEQLEHLSFKGQKALFARLEELARIANMNKKERAEYEAALKIYRDNENVVTTARREGKEEGIAIGEERGLKKGILTTARLMKQNGISFEQIKLCTGLSDEEIRHL